MIDYILRKSFLQGIICVQSALDLICYRSLDFIRTQVCTLRRDFTWQVSRYIWQQSNNKKFAHFYMYGNKITQWLAIMSRGDVLCVLSVQKSDWLQIPLRHSHSKYASDVTVHLNFTSNIYIQDTRTMTIGN